MNIRYQKRSEYDDYVFLADKERNEELESYNNLKIMSEKLSDKYTTYLPIFHSDEHNVCSIRFKKDEGKSKLFKKNCLYSVEFIIKNKEYKNENYVNCFIQKFKLINKAEYSCDGDELGAL